MNTIKVILKGKTVVIQVLGEDDLTSQVISKNQMWVRMVESVCKDRTSLSELKEQLELAVMQERVSDAQHILSRICEIRNSYKNRKKKK